MRKNTYIVICYEKIGGSSSVYVVKAGSREKAFKKIKKYFRLEDSVYSNHYIEVKDMPYKII